MADPLKQRRSLSIWFDVELEWHASSTAKRGRQRKFSHAEFQVVLMMKVLSDIRLCQTAGFVERLLRLAYPSQSP